MDLFTFLLCKKKGGGGVTYTLSADTVNKQIVLTPSKGDAQAITVPYATDASTVNGKDVPELENGKIPATYLPSYVDDVLEYEDLAHFPAEGEVGKIYIALDTSLIYRWSGSVYAEISQSLALGETEATAYRGDRGKIAYDHSQSAHAPSNAEANQNAFSNITVGDTTIEANSKTDTLTLEAGSNITLTPDTSTDKVTITATDTTYSDATTSTSGLMSGSDKTKLNGIATGAEVNQNAFSNVKIGSTTVAADSKTDTLEIAASFSDGSDLPLKSLTASIVPVQAGSGDPSPTNVRPISGWTEEVIKRTGTNLIGGNLFANAVKNAMPSATIDEAEKTVSFTSSATLDNYIVVNDRTYGDYYIPFKENTSYTFVLVGYNSKTTANASNLRIYYTDGTNTTLSFDSTSATKQTKIYTTPASKTVNRLSKTNQDGTAVLYYDECGIFEGAITAQDFEPYAGTTTSIPFTDSQGNPVEVYGGSVDVVNGGEQQGTFGSMDLSTLDWTFTGTYGRATNIFTAFLITAVVAGATVADALCNIYKTIDNESLYANGTNNAFSLVRTASEQYTRIRINDTAYSDAQAFKTALQNANAKLVYPLATPTTFYTQPTAVKSLDGVNNVFASTGPLREVTYRTQAYGDFIATRDLPDAISDIKTLKLDENQILIGDGNFNKIGLFMDDYYDENLDTTFTTEVTPQEIYLTSQPAESVNQTTIISGDRTEYQTSLLSGTEVINTVNAIGMEVNVKENGSITHGIKIVSGDIRLLGSDTWDGTNISLKNALEAIQNNLYIANYNKTASLSSGSNTIALDMTGYTYNGSDIVNVYVDGLYKVNNTDYTITVNDSTGVASINYTAAAAATMAIQVIKPKIGFTALTDSNGDNVTDNSGNSIDIQEVAYE